MPINNYIITPDGNFISEDELYHYGVLGMKWGVRRYQNKDGSYTKRGMERYRQAESAYDSAKKNYNDAKNGGNAAQIKSAKRSMRSAKKKMNSAYERLSSDYRADKGRELYSKGKTISGNTIDRRRAQAVALGVAYVADNKITKYFNSRQAVLITKKYGKIPMALLSRAVINTGLLATEAILGIKNYSDNKKLKSYYGHVRH